MRVQHGADARLLPAATHVQQRLGRRLAAASGDRLAVLVDDDEIVARQPALVLAAGGDEQPQRLAAEDDAVVAAGADRPAALVEEPGQVSQVGHRVDQGRLVRGSDGSRHEQVPTSSVLDTRQRWCYCS